MEAAFVSMLLTRNFPIADFDQSTHEVDWRDIRLGNDANRALALAIAAERFPIRERELERIRENWGMKYWPVDMLVATLVDDDVEFWKFLLDKSSSERMRKHLSDFRISQYDGFFLDHRSLRSGYQSLVAYNALRSDSLRTEAKSVFQKSGFDFERWQEIASLAEFLGSEAWSHPQFAEILDTMRKADISESRIRNDLFFSRQIASYERLTTPEAGYIFDIITQTYKIPSTNANVKIDSNYWQGSLLPQIAKSSSSLAFLSKADAAIFFRNFSIIAGENSPFLPNRLMQIHLESWQRYLFSNQEAASTLLDPEFPEFCLQLKKAFLLEILKPVDIVQAAAAFRSFPDKQAVLARVGTPAFKRMLTIVRGHFEATDIDISSLSAILTFLSTPDIDSLVRRIEALERNSGAHEKLTANDLSLLVEVTKNPRLAALFDDRAGLEEYARTFFVAHPATPRESLDRIKRSEK